MEGLEAYVPMDRRQALARGFDLPDRATGAALFADISGFTLLAEGLTARLGPQRGAEELTRQLNQVYDVLVASLHGYCGSIIGFVGDAVTCWFDQDLSASLGTAPGAGREVAPAGLRAVACALQMQRAIAPFARVEVVPEVKAALSIKVGIAAGLARRFRVGDPTVQYIDVLGGDTLRKMSRAEGLARKGEVLLDAGVLAQVSEDVTVREWLKSPETGQNFAVIGELLRSVDSAPWPDLPVDALGEAQVRSWLLPPVYERLKADQGLFLSELRPAVSLFLKFGGLDYDRDRSAGEKLDAYIRWVQGIVERFEGSLIQLTIGDKGSFLYVAFGAPVAHDDDTARALLAALALRALPSELDFITSAQVGLARGQARTGAYGSQRRRSYGVIGDDVVLAARLMGVAPPGEIRCAYSVYRQLKDRFAFESLRPVRVKGKAGKIRVYRPLRQKGKGGQPADIIVGRQAQVAQLMDSLDAIQAGETQVLVIEGEAGIGKSRMVSELARLVRERGLTGLLGAGQSVERRTPYRAWRDVFSSYFAIDDVTDRVEQQRRVRAVIEQLAPEQIQRLPLLNDLLNLGFPENDLTASLDSSLRQESLTLLLTRLLRLWAQDQPLTVVLEDAHWLDSLSWGLAERVARSLSVSEVPFLLVLVSRPLEPDSLGAERLAQLKALTVGQTMTLAALGPAAVEELIAHRLGVQVDALPAALSELIQARAGGNPFFAEELILALRDQGVVTVEDGRCYVAGDLARVRGALPDTLHGLILARIDRLSPERQFILKVAAVVGRTFAYTPLHYTLNQYALILEQVLREHLQALHGADFTFLKSLEPDLTYVFKHIITQEAAYQTLLFAQRRQLHRTVAAWYEATFGEGGQLATYYPLLAHHYRQAEAPEQERRYAKLAGEQAATQFANAEAVAYLSRALALTTQADDAERYALLLARERVRDLQGERQAQQQDLTALEELAEHQEDDQRRAEVALRRAHYATVTTDYPGAIAAARTAIALSRAGYAVDLEAAGYLHWGKALGRRGDYGAAQRPLERALDLIQSERPERAEQAQRGGILAVTTRSLEADILRTLGGAFWGQSAYVEARRYLEQALYIDHEIGDRRGEGWTYNNLGLVAENVSAFREAINCYEKAQGIFGETGDRWGESIALGNLGYVHARVGLYTRARDYYQRDLHICREIGDRRGEAWTRGYLSLLFHQMGDNERAVEYGEQALVPLQDINDRRARGEVLNHLAHALTELGHWDEATDVYRQTVTLWRELAEDHLAMEASAGLARVALRQGDLGLALARINEILDYLETGTLDRTEEPLRVYLTCYRVLRANQDARAQGILATAHRLLQEQAARIDDEALNRSLLENVAAHREIMAEWARVGE